MKAFQPQLSKEQAQALLISKISAVRKEIFLASHTTETEKEDLFAIRLQQLLTPASEQTDFTGVREVTVLFCSLKDFTLLCKNIQPHTVIDMLSRYFSIMSDIIQHFNGHMGTLIGNSLLAIFDTPIDKPYKLQAVLNCAVQMQIAMTHFNHMNASQNLPELTMGIGINSGSAIVGKLRATAHSQYTFVGDDVRLAAQIEPHSLRGQVLISESTYQLAKSSIATGEANPVHLKGRKDVVNIYELQAITYPHYLAVPKIEVRQNLRVLVNAPITFQHVKNQQAMPDVYHGEVIDLSYKGMLASIKEPIELYAEIKLMLTLSLLDNKTSDVYGKVLKITKEEDGYYIGVLFTSLSDHAQSAIKNFVDSMV